MSCTGSRSAALFALAVAAAGCGAKSVPPELKQAEQLGDQERWAEALPLYQKLVDQRCAGAPHDVTDWTLRKVCGPAALGIGHALAALGRVKEAIEAYLKVAPLVGSRGRAAARAIERAADLHMHAGQATRAHELHYQAILGYPDSAAADDALRVLVRDGTKRDPKNLLRILLELQPQVADGAIGDNLLFEAALLTENPAASGDLEAAVALYDRLPIEYPRSGLRDDGWRNAARLLRGMGRPADAVERLRAFLATKATARMIGSYNSPFLPDAAIEAGRITLEDLKDPRGARAWFQQAYDDYPKSTRRDDAAVWIAVAYEAAGDARSACATLARHAKRFPERRTSSARADELASRLGCSAPTPPTPPAVTAAGESR